MTAEPAGPNDWAIALMDAGKYHEYERAAAEMVAEHPGDAYAHLHHGAALWLVGRGGEARAELVAAVAQSDDDPEVLTRAASTLLSLGEFELAQEYVTRAGSLVQLSRFALGAELVHLAGCLAVEQGDYDRARQLLTAAFEVGPAERGHARYAKVLARFLATQGDADEARAVVERAFADHPDDTELIAMRTAPGLDDTSWLL
jgi:tetratricopeptide (TPR) repeat protein